jgi:hypothetical protein
MHPLDLGPVGIALNVSADDSHLAEAAELEKLGYAALWLPGGQIDRLDRIEAIMGATTAVPPGPTRSCSPSWIRTASPDGRMRPGSSLPSSSAEHCPPSWARRVDRPRFA